MKRVLFRGYAMVFFSIFGVVSASAQSVEFPTYPKLERDMRVLSLVTLKKGDTCIGVTKLSLRECMELGEKFGRTTELFIGGDGKQMFIVPLYVGEQIGFVRYMEDGHVRVKYILSKKR